MHVSAFLYAAAERGEIPWELVHAIGREHLAARCDTCAEGVKALESGLEEVRLADLRPPTDPLEALRRRRGLSRRQLQDEVKLARHWLRRLLRKVPARKRLGTVKGAYKYYRGSVFGVLLLEEARAAIPHDPAESLSLAEAALESCAKTHPNDPDPQIRVPALAVKGNALRALGRLGEAEKALLEAARLLDASDLDDLVLAAEVDFHLGSLRTEQRHPTLGARHLERAAWFYRLLGDAEKGAATFLRLSIVHHWVHEFDEAIVAAEGALELLGAKATSWLAAYARFNLARYLHGRGDLDRAEAELDQHRELLDAAGETVRAHVTWLRARIAWSRGELAKADRKFREALRWAREREDPFDAGLLCLERALVHLAQGRGDRVQRLAAQALGFFRRAEEVERETRGALELLETAARQEELTRKALEHAVARLEGDRHRRGGGDPDGSGG